MPTPITATTPAIIHLVPLFNAHEGFPVNPTEAIARKISAVTKRQQVHPLGAVSVSHGVTSA